MKIKNLNITKPDQTKQNKKKKNWEKIINKTYHRMNYLTYKISKRPPAIKEMARDMNNQFTQKLPKGHKHETTACFAYNEKAN